MTRYDVRERQRPGLFARTVSVYNIWAFIVKLFLKFVLPSGYPYSIKRQRNIDGFGGKDSQLRTKEREEKEFPQPGRGESEEQGRPATIPLRALIRRLFSRRERKAMKIK